MGARQGDSEVKGACHKLDNLSLTCWTRMLEGEN